MSAAPSVSDPANQRLSRLFWLIVIFGALALFFVINFRVVVVDGHSMEPTYRAGQRLLMTNAYWLFGRIDRGDVVVIRIPTGNLLIKRVVALPGEEVPEAYRGPVNVSLGTRVPEGHIFVVGDNLERSEDSRVLGFISLRWVEGKIVGGKGELP
ncbi:MAG: signal peptidase I [Armatimonadota bacterium]